MLTQNRPAARIFGHEVETRPTSSRIIGGSSDSEWNDWHENPAGTPSAMPVTIVTPDG